jgi:hypothetical protein
MSLELRTPLTVIRGNVDLIRRTGQADSESLEAVVSEVDRMTRMVQDVLLLAQAESGKLPLGRELVELDTLLLEVFQQAKLLAQGRQEVRLGQEDQARVIGSRPAETGPAEPGGECRGLHAPGGVVTIMLACVGGWARLTISDTGPGIPKDELPTSSSASTGSIEARRRSARRRRRPGSLDRILDCEDARRTDRGRLEEGRDDFSSLAASANGSDRATGRRRLRVTAPGRPCGKDGRRGV